MGKGAGCLGKSFGEVSRSGENLQRVGNGSTSCAAFGGGDISGENREFNLRLIKKKKGGIREAISQEASAYLKDVLKPLLWVETQESEEQSMCVCFEWGWGGSEDLCRWTLVVSVWTHSMVCTDPHSSYRKVI